MEPNGSIYLFFWRGQRLDFSKLMHFREHFLVTLVMWITALKGVMNWNVSVMNWNVSVMNWNVSVMNWNVSTPVENPVLPSIYKGRISVQKMCPYKYL